MIELISTESTYRLALYSRILFFLIESNEFSISYYAFALLGWT
jgi:hypothetical protein